ncbi:MAG: hypothetical protein H6Q68_3589 [Firmicutes bacterium]|nr:hypothetical protein [Bacillota bacterium]
MKKLLVILCLFLGLHSIAWASPNDSVNPSSQPNISVIVLANPSILVDNKFVTEIRAALKEKFKQATSVVIYGDDQAKSPEFLEFIEKVQTDPNNEKGIRVISNTALAEYGRATKSNYVILIKVTNCNYIIGSHTDMKGQVSVIDVASQKYVENRTWYKEETWWTEGTRYLIKRLATDFNWSPSMEVANNNQTSTQEDEKKSSVVVFLPDVILEKPELVEQVRKTVSEKFKVSDVPIFIDDKPKSPEFLKFIGDVITDSAKQQAFVLKKERLVEYGKSTNSNPMTVILVKSDYRGGYSYRLKEEILVVDTDSNKYLANVVYDMGDGNNRRDGIHFLMDKLQNEFKLP